MPPLPFQQQRQPEPPTAEAPDISINEAARDGNIEAVKQHLTAGADVNAKDKTDWTPLHYAAREGHNEIAELLVENGVDVNAKNEDGYTPLLYAAIMGHTEIVELLIAAGADLNAKDEGGETPLDWTTNPDNPNDTAEIADLLRKHGGKTAEELKAKGK